MAQLESATGVQSSFSANAYLLTPGTIIGTVPGTMRSIFWADAVTRRTMSSSFTANAWKVGGGRVTANATIIGRRRFTADAVLV